MNIVLGVKIIENWNLRILFIKVYFSAHNFGLCECVTLFGHFCSVSKNIYNLKKKSLKPANWKYFEMHQQ